MGASTFERFCEIAYEQAGIRLREGKEALVSSRVGKRMRALGIRSDRDYLKLLESDPSGAELASFLDVISTNFTSFFRERDHFEALREQLSGRLDAGARRLRLWSCASSSGEEPYSMAMVIDELVRERALEVDYLILATDISTRILERARRGRYEREVTATIPTRYQRWLVAAEDGQVELAPELRSRVVFKRLNLAAPPFPMRGPLDVVFCRNVMIYFDAPVRQRLVTALESLLAPGGLLCTGHSETFAGLQHSLSGVRPSVYRRPEGVALGVAS